MLTLTSGGASNPNVRRISSAHWHATDGDGSNHRTSSHHRITWTAMVSASIAANASSTFRRSFGAFPSGANTAGQVRSSTGAVPCGPHPGSRPGSSCPKPEARSRRPCRELSSRLQERCLDACGVWCGVADVIRRCLPCRHHLVNGLASFLRVLKLERFRVWCSVVLGASFFVLGFSASTKDGREDP